MQHQIRHVRLPKESNIDDVKLGRTFYHCSCGTSLSFCGLSREYCFEVEKLNLGSSHWAVDDKTLGGHMTSLCLEVGKKPGVADSKKQPTSQL